MDEQRHLATARHRDPIIAHTLQALGTSLIVTLPLPLKGSFPHVFSSLDGGDTGQLREVAVECALGEV